MTDIPAPPTAPTPASTPEPKPNSFSRIIGVLFSPDETFDSIARRPDWVVPLVLIMIIALGVGATIAQRTDFAAPAREAMEQQKNVPPERMEMALKWSTMIGKFVSYASPILSAVIFLIIAGVLLLVCRLFGGEGGFEQAFSATVYAWIPQSIKALIMLAILLARGGIISAVDLATIVRSNPAFLVSMKTNPLLFALLTNVDLFGIWTLILFIIAFAHVARVSKGKSAAIMISARLIVLLFGLIGPGIQSLRK